MRSQGTDSEWEELVVRDRSKLREEKTSCRSRVRRRWQRLREGSQIGTLPDWGFQYCRVPGGCREAS